jgi:hypothetical protein
MSYLFNLASTLRRSPPVVIAPVVAAPVVVVEVPVVDVPVVVEVAPEPVAVQVLQEEEATPAASEE